MLNVLAALLLAFLMTSPLRAQETTTLKTAEHPNLGQYLAGQAGLSIYLFEEDRREGERGRPVESDCHGDCLTRWPPVPGEPLPRAGTGIEADLIGSFKRPDGKVQAMYNGWPLYYFADDFVAGDVNGHDFEEFGGEWYLLTPSGEQVPGSSGGDDDDDKDDDD
jgi:predicted lipoprotein with Yx(FWY)xxD motif